MTRAERAAEKLRKAKEKAEALQRLHKEQMVAQHAERRKAELVFREETRKADKRRCARIGELAQEAGLFVWSDTELAGLFQILATLTPCPDPVAFLAGLLCPSMAAQREQVASVLSDGIALVIS